jgi:anti-sigma factor RsiW
MTCAEVNERIIDQLYGELASSDVGPFEAHLAGCESCRRERDGLARTRRTARTLLDGPLASAPPQRVRREVMEAAELAVRARVAAPL